MTIPSSDPPETDRPGGGISDADEAGGDRVRASESSRVRRLALHFTVVLLGASAVALFASGPRAGVSVALGVVLAGANILVMQKITSMMAAQHGGSVSGASGSGGSVSGGSVSGGGAVWGLLLPFKLVALVGVAYALVARGVAQPVPFAMGFALLPLTGVFLPRPTTVQGRVPPRLHSR